MYSDNQMWVLVFIGFLVYGIADIFFFRNRLGVFIKLIAIVMIFVPLIALFHVANIKPKIIKYGDIVILSTADSSSNFTNGIFFLGSGTINTEEVYLGNVKTYDGGIQRIYIPVKSVVRYVDNNLTNYAIYRKLYCQSKNILVHTDIEHCYEMDHSIKDKLFIPKNSIIKQLKFQ